MKHFQEDTNIKLQLFLIIYFKKLEDYWVFPSSRVLRRTKVNWTKIQNRVGQISTWSLDRVIMNIFKLSEIRGYFGCQKVGFRTENYHMLFSLQRSLDQKGSNSFTEKVTMEYFIPENVNRKCLWSFVDLKGWRKFVRW